MIRTATISDCENALCLSKTGKNDRCSAGITFRGFGTKPIPGTICEDAIQKALRFSAYHICQKFDLLLSSECSDMEEVKHQLTQCLERLNNSISSFGCRIGQGIYIAGTACYVAEDRYICFSFGGGYACLFDGQNIFPLGNNEVPENHNAAYILDAIGGTNNWIPSFQEGPFPIGAQLTCMTQKPPETLIPSIMGRLAHKDPSYVVTEIYKGMKDMEQPDPNAVLTISHAAIIRRTGGEQQ